MREGVSKEKNLPHLQLNRKNDRRFECLFHWHLDELKASFITFVAIWYGNDAISLSAKIRISLISAVAAERTINFSASFAVWSNLCHADYDVKHRKISPASSESCYFIHTHTLTFTLRHTHTYLHTNYLGCLQWTERARVRESERLI